MWFRSVIKGASRTRNRFQPLCIVEKKLIIEAHYDYALWFAIFTFVFRLTTAYGFLEILGNILWLNIVENGNTCWNFSFGINFHLTFTFEMYAEGGKESRADFIFKVRERLLIRKMLNTLWFASVALTGNVLIRIVTQRETSAEISFGTGEIWRLTEILESKEGGNDVLYEFTENSSWISASVKLVWIENRIKPWKNYSKLCGYTFLV